MKYLVVGIFATLFLVFSPAFSAKSKKATLSSKQKTSKGLMSKSKKELLMILNSFKDQDGREILKIEKLSKSRYKVYMKPKKGKCMAQKVKTAGLKPVYDLKVYPCD